MYTKEKTIPSSSAIAGKLVAIAGATGNVGEGLARAFLRAGATVLVLTRSEEKFRVLRQQLDGEATDKLVAVTGDTSSLEGMRALAARIEAEHGPIDHAVVSLGQWWQGRPLWDVTEEEFQHYFVGTATLHFAAARALIPLIRDGGSYTILAGLSAIKPIEGASLIGMAGAAHLMLARELQADLGDRLRVNSLVLGFIRSRGRVAGKPSWLIADEVGDLTIRIAGSQLGGTQIRADDRTVAQQSLMEFGL